MACPSTPFPRWLADDMSQVHTRLLTLLALLALLSCPLLFPAAAQGQRPPQRLTLLIVDVDSLPLAGEQLSYRAEDGQRYGQCTSNAQGHCEISVDEAAPEVGVTMRGTLIIEGRGELPVIWMTRDGGLERTIQLTADGGVDLPHDVLATRAPDQSMPTAVAPDALAATATRLAIDSITVTPHPDLAVTVSAVMAAQTATALSRGEATTVEATAISSPLASASNTPLPSPDATPDNEGQSRGQANWLLRFFLILIAGCLFILTLSLFRQRRPQ